MSEQSASGEQSAAELSAGEHSAERTILDRIHDLVAEEHTLRSGGHGLSREDRDRLRVIETRLDQAWDLLRQRRARAETGESPDAASERSADEVEGYLQ